MDRQYVRLILCSVLVLGMTAPVAAQTPSDLPLKMRGKDWCQASSDPGSAFPNGKFKNFNLRDAYTITITPDPSGNGAMTANLSKDPNKTVDPSLPELSLQGHGLFRNKSNHKIEFVLNGVQLSDPDKLPTGIFITLRGQASIDKDTGVIKQAKGTFVYERDDKNNEDPAVHCFGSGTFGKHEDHPHPEDTTPHF